MTRCILYENKRKLTRKLTWKSRKYNRVMGQGKVGRKSASDDKSIWVKLLSKASRKGKADHLAVISSMGSKCTRCRG